MNESDLPVSQAVQALLKRLDQMEAELSQSLDVLAASMQERRVMPSLLSTLLVALLGVALLAVVFL